MVIKPMGQDHHGWKGDNVGYATLHNRLLRTRGQATEHLCVNCGDQAVEWAYNHSDANERISPQGYPYTPNLDAYDPLCKPCHVRRDRRTA